MTYKEYLMFYDLDATDETYVDWLYSEWHHGRVYKFEGDFFSTLTGEKVDQKNYLLKESNGEELYRINREKLNSYLDSEMIIEFVSDEDCLNYFNTYDGQHFKTVNEMKKYQGPYGFGLDGKWYHVNFDEALDVREPLSLAEQIKSASAEITQTKSSIEYKQR